MEDLSRDLEQRVARCPSLLEIWRRRGRWTVLLVDDLGQLAVVRGLRIWGRLLVLLLAAALLAAVLCLAALQRMGAARAAQEAALAQGQRDLAALRSENASLLARALLAEARGGSDRDTERPEAPAVAPAATPAVVAIEDFGASRGSGGRVQVRFRLNNLGSGSPLNGFTFVLFKPAAGEPRPPEALPPVALEAGVPADVRRGRPFAISRYTTVRFHERLGGDLAVFRSATVLVYGADGALWREQSFALAEG
jgi:hypothetical protein